MALTQEQVNAWFDANPNATADDVAAAVKSIGGLEANQGLAGMIANRFSIAEPEVTNYYNAYTAPKVDTPTFTDTITSGRGTSEDDFLATIAAPADNITSTGGVTKSATAPTSGGVSKVIEGDDIDTQIAQLPEEYASWRRDGQYMVLIRKSDGAELDRRFNPEMSDVQLLKTGLSFVPGAGQILAAVNIADAIANNNLAGALIGATGLDPSLANVNTALRVGQAVDTGNTLGALTALAGNSDLQKLVGADTTTIGGLTTKDAVAAANLAKAATDGNVGGVITNLGTLTNSADTRLAGQAVNLIQALESGNINALTQAVNLANNVIGTSGSTSGAGSTTVGDFEDTEVTRLKGLGYTKEQIQEYFRNLDNLTGVFDETSTLGTDTQTGGSTTSTTDTTSTSGTGATDLDDLIDTLTVTGANTDSGLSNQNILDMINGTDDTVVVTGKTDKDTVTGVDTITGVGGTGTDGTDKDGTVTVVGDRECAAGFHRDDVTGLCVADSDQQALDCPEGYEPNDAGTACIPRIEIVDKKCNPGFVYDEDLKQCVAIKPEGCAPGFHDDGTGFCVPDTDLDCPEGYEPNEAGTACIPVVEIKDKKCGPGFVYDEELQKCVAVEDDTCAPGFHRDDVTGLCVADEEALDCPEGYEPNEAGTACIPIIEIVDNKCKPGYVFDEALQKCVPIDDDKCATGFHRDEVSGLCVPDDDDQCKSGYEKVNGVCVPVCKEGYIRNLATGVCEKVDDKSCPVGQVRNAEGKCVPIVTPPPPPKTCPTGFKLVNGTCVPIATTPTYTPSGSYGPGEKNEPIYAGGMDEFNLLATLQELLAEEAPKKDDKKSKDKTKMATGGHLDDLLAEQMTVDDLLKLLR